MKWGAAQMFGALWLMIPLGLAVYFLLKQRRRRRESLAEAGVFMQLAPGWVPGRLRVRATLWLAAVLLALLALARPQWGFHLEEVKRRGLDIVVVLDTSRSMLAEDIKPNRLQQAKWGIRDLVGRLRGDRIGLVAFAGSSFLQCPLTIDYAAFLMTLEDVYAGIIPRGGTAITQALRTAMESFEKNPDADRAIVLITDGEDHEGNPVELVDELKRENIRVYSIGVGSTDGELIPQSGDQGGTGFLKDRQGRVVKTSLKEDVLQRIALSTGGAYVRSAPGDTGLEKIFEQGLATLKRDDGESKTVRIYEDRFAWLVGAALLLLLIEAALPHRRRGVEVAA
jgi:Ca-activated chloride channel family protein